MRSRSTSAKMAFTAARLRQREDGGVSSRAEVLDPESPSHRRAIRPHDLHHVATGFGTDNAGEGELSAWPLRRGLRGTGAYVGAIVVMNTTVGLLVASRRT